MMELRDIWDAIKDKIDNPDNYLRLAEYYLDINQNLSYLSLENALFFEKDKSKKNQIDEMIQLFKSEGYVTIPPVSIVLLSFHNLNYTRECIDSIRRNCIKGSYEIIVVDNGSEEEVIKWLKEQNDIKLILNEENKGFPAGCNQGILAAEEGNDIFLLNNDTVVLPNSLYCLRMALYSDESFGAVGAMGCNVPNNQQVENLNNLDECFDYAIHNNIPRTDTYERKVWLVGFALLIRHDVQKNVGLLDERFTPGCYEDNDYCYRILEAGYKNMLCHNCVIYHYGSQGFKHEQDRIKYTELTRANLDKINKKWGLNIGYHLHQRNEIVKLIEREHPDHGDKFSLIEWDRGIGASLIGIKDLYENVEIYAPQDQKEPVDYIIFDHCLEKQKDPYRLLKECRTLLKSDGKVIACLPNIMHFSVIIPLLKGEYRFERDGIRDYANLHNFTCENINDMFSECGYVIEEMYDLIVGEENWSSNISECDIEWFLSEMKKTGINNEDQFFPYYYLICAKKC